MASALPEGSTSIFRPWKGDQAFLALEATLGAGCPVACLTQFDWNKVRQDFGESPYHRGFMREVWGEKQKKVAETVALSSHQGQSFADVKSALVQTLQKFLPNGLDGLTDDAELDELGLDSLSGVEASRALAAALAPFGVKSVKPTFLFEANCLNAILSKFEVPTILPEAAVLPTVAPQAAALKKVPQASSADIKEAVIDSLSRFLPNGREGLTDTAEFDELGLDSLSGVEASRALAAALNPLGITGIKPTFLFEANSLQSLLAKTFV
jgi:acyl carrier protein